MTVADRWFGLQLRHLAALKAVAEEGTFAAAAARLGYTQSAISQQIAALERITGVSLLERPPGKRPRGLTLAGEIVLRHAAAMFARADALEADLAAAAGAEATLRLGIYQSIGVHVLPRLLQRFGSEWPTVELQLRESSSDVELLALVERAELDLTFCMLPVGPGPFETMELFADEYVLVVPSDSPLTRRRRLTVADVARLPLISFRSCRNEHRIESQFRARGFEPTVVFRSDDNATVQALVGHGAGAALMPRLTVSFTDAATAFLDVSSLFPPRLVGLVWHRDRELSTPAQVLMDAARDLCHVTSSGPPLQQQQRVA
jgi:DNA-binding transcriptional LysR family regulator